MKNASLGTDRSAVEWAAPLISEYQERAVLRRGVCIEFGCRVQIALQRNMRHLGGNKSDSPDCVPAIWECGSRESGPLPNLQKSAPARRSGEGRAQ